MNTLNDVLTPLQTKIAFVSANNPGGGGGGTVPQTGDAIGIVLAIIAALAVICVATYSIVSKQKIASARSVGIVDADISLMQKSRRRITLALSAVVAICLASLIWIYSPLHSAIAGTDGDISGSDVVYAHVDETTGAVTVDDGVIVNNTNNDVYITSSTLKFVETDEDKITAPSDIKLSVTGLDSTLFNGSVGEKWTEKDGDIVLKTTLPAGKQTPLHFTISDLKLQDARNLIGKTAYFIELEEAPCYTVNYFANGADEGTVPNAGIMKETDASVNIVGNTGDLDYWGFNYICWNTKADGTGTDYKAGDVYSTKESLNLYAKWQEKEDVTITYKVDPDHKGGNVKLLNSAGTESDTEVSETVAPRTGDPKGATVTNVVNDDFAFIGWYTESGESLGNAKEVKPERNDHKCWDKVTYIARFEKVTKVNIVAESEDENRGKVTSEITKDVYTGSQYLVTTKDQVSIITITDLLDPTKTQQIIAAGEGKYMFDHWVYTDDKGVEHPVGTDGYIVGNMKFKAYFYSNEEVTINISISEDALLGEQGWFKYNGGKAITDITLEHVDSGQANLSELEALVNEENMFDYKFAYWEFDFNDGLPVKVTDSKYTPSLSALGKQHWANNMTITCYFIAPKAIYTSEDATMRFVYDTAYYPSGDDGQIVFPVIPDSYYDPDDKLQSKFPAWVYGDGVPIVFPRNIIFETSFKGYTELTSTSYWFSSQLSYRQGKKASRLDGLSDDNLTLAEVLKGDTQPRVIQNVEGLENVYTENLADTSFMFASRNRNDLPLESLDFSSWNLPKCTKMRGMFYGNLFLKDLKLPADTEGHYFGSYATDMSLMFYMCASLKSFECQGTFGNKALLLQSMFYGCKNLGSFTTGEYFGSAAINTALMFKYCERLYEVNMGSKFGNYVEYAREMFSDCLALQHINFNSVFGKSLKDAEAMFKECMYLASVDLSNFNLNYNEEDNAEGMFYDCYSLIQIKIGQNFLYSFSDLYPINTRWYISDTGTESYPAGSLPLRTSSGDHSLAYTYRAFAPKAVYDKEKSTFTFSCDHIAHNSVNEVMYYVLPYSGFVTGNYTNMSLMTQADYLATDNETKKRQLAKRSAMLLPAWYRFTGDEPLYEIKDASLSTKIEYLSRPFTETTVSAMLSKFECMVDAKTVEFKGSFSSYTDLASTSLWFIADSYGKQPFETFKGLYNIPIENLESVSCMFGGFCFEMMCPYESWKEQSQLNYYASTYERFIDYVKQQMTGSSGLQSTVQKIGSKYDTYGTSIRELDLTEFAPLYKGALGSMSVNGRVDMSSLLANCCALEKLTLPQDDDYAYIEDPRYPTETLSSQNSDDLYTISSINEDNAAAAGSSWYELYYGPTQYIGGLNGFFMNCENLKTIENLPALFRHYNTLSDSARTKIPGFMVYRMFSGCRSLESVDLRDLPAYMIEMVNNGPWIFEGLLANCDSLKTIYTYDGYDDPDPYRKNMRKYIWSKEFALFGLPDFADDNNPWTLYYRVAPQPIDLFGNVDFSASSVDLEGTETSDDPDYPNKFDGDLTTVNIPYYLTENKGEVYLWGKFVRNDQAGYTLNFDVSDENAGSIYYSNDNSEEKIDVADMNFVTPATYYVYGDELFVNGIGISAKAADGYQFNHWEIDGRMISSTSGSGTLENVSGDATFTACFDTAGTTAKAVYRESNGETSLTFVYDDKTAEEIQTSDPSVVKVYKVNPDTYFENKYAASLPSWMKLVYKAETGKIDTKDEDPSSDIAVPAAEAKHKASNKIEREIGQLVIDDSERKVYDIGGNAYYLLNDKGFRELIFNEAWQIEWDVQPQSIIFDSSFKNFDGLESISGWFMADDSGLQPVKKFYSKDANGVLHDGDRAFENLNTVSLKNVAYAFGGISYPSRRQTSLPELYDLATAKSSSTALELLNASAWGEPQEVLPSYGNTYETYGRSLTEINLKSFDMSNLPSIDYMFANALMLNKITFPSPASGQTSILSNCNSMVGVFYQCESLKDMSSLVGMEKFDTSNVEYMDAMFYSCSGLTSLDLRNFNTENLHYDYWNNLSQYNPRSTEVNYSVSAIQNTYGMFYECTRLSELYVSSEYDVDWWKNGNLTHLSGWTVNLGNESSLGCLPNYNYYDDDNYWMAGNKPVNNTYYFPCDIEIMASGIRPEQISQINSGRYHLNKEIKTFNINFEVDATDTGGTINGYNKTAYNFVRTANIHMDPYDANTIWADNLLYVAEPSSDDYIFSYWTYGKGFSEDLQGEVVGNDLRMYFESYNYENEVTFVAHFTNDKRKAKAVFTAENQQGNLKFVYDENNYEVGKDGVLAVYAVNPNCNTYSPPAWYKLIGEYGKVGDDRPVVAIDPVIENNSSKGVSVVFDNSFADYDQLTSMSCWFMPSVSNKDQDNLYVPFSDKPYITTQTDEVSFELDLSNVNTTSLASVGYMFGGSGAISDYGGTTLNTIKLTMPTNCKLTSLDAWFANCVRLKDIEFKNEFDTSYVTSMAYMFYNCPNLVYEYTGTTVDLPNILNKFNTSNVTDMSYMFAQTQTVYSRKFWPAVDPDTGEEHTYPAKINFPTAANANFTTENVENFEGMFSGYYNAKSITVTGNFVVKAENSEKGISMQRMFANNPYMESVNLPASFDTVNVKYMGHMFYNDYRLGYVAPPAEQEPDITKFKKASQCIVVGDNSTINLNSAIETNSMFYGCESLAGFDLTKERCEMIDGMIVGAILDANGMFYHCVSLQTLDLTNYYIIKHSTGDINPYEKVTTSTTTLGPGGSTSTAIAYLAHPSYALAGYTLQNLHTFTIGNNADDTNDYWLQWNTEISFYNALYQSIGVDYISRLDEGIGYLDDTIRQSWINKSTAHCVCDVHAWPIAISDVSQILTGVQNPFGTYLKQNVGIYFDPSTSNSGLYFDNVSRSQINLKEFAAGYNLYFGYGNGFNATYTVSPVPGEEDFLVISFTFTSIEDSNISNTQTINLQSPSSIAGLECTIQTSDGSYDKEIDAMITNAPVDDLFEHYSGDKLFVLFSVWPSKEVLLPNVVENNDLNEDEAVQDSNSTLEEDIEAADATSSAIGELVNSEEPVGELATAALSLLSFTVPWEFFTMCLEIIF